MKLSKMVVAVLVCTSLFACSKDDKNPNMTDETKSVGLKLEGISAAKNVKSSRAGAQDPTSNDAEISVNKVDILFYDSTTGIIYSADAGILSSSAEWNELISANGKIYHNVDGRVSAVMVIGNSEITKGLTISESLVGKNINTVKNTVLNIKNENEPSAGSAATNSNITLYGNGNVVATGETDTDGGKLYKAEVTISPLVSRIEITGIECEDLSDQSVTASNTLFDKLVLKTIGLIGYNTNAVLGTGVVSNPIVNGTGVYTPAVNVTPESWEFAGNIFEPIPSSAGSGVYPYASADWTVYKTGKTNIYMFGTTGSGDASDYIYNADYKWSYDNFAASTELDASTKSLNMNGKVYAYNFFPGLNTEKLPNIKLYVGLQKNGADVVYQPNYNSFVTSDITIPAASDGGKVVPGRVYKVNYKFKSANIGPWNPQEAICVKVIVTVEKWKVVTPTVSFL